MVLKKIEGVIKQVCYDIASEKAPALTYSSTASWNEVSFRTEKGFELKRNQKMTTVRFDACQSVKKFGMMMKILSFMYGLIKEKKYCTKRTQLTNMIAITFKLSKLSTTTSVTKSIMYILDYFVVGSGI
ncbi:endodeoxyribonuclease [Mactra antiquata]